MRRRWSTLPEQQSPTACRRCATVPSRTGAPISIPQRMAPGGWKHQPRSSPPPACACGSGVLHQGPAAGPMVPGLRNPAVQGSSRAGRRAQVAENVKAPADHDRDGSSALSLSNVRDALIKLEDTIIFTLVERSQFKSNHLAYQSGACRPAISSIVHLRAWIGCHGQSLVLHSVSSSGFVVIHLQQRCSAYPETLSTLDLAQVDPTKASLRSQRHLPYI